MREDTSGRNEVVDECLMASEEEGESVVKGEGVAESWHRGRKAWESDGIILIEVDGTQTAVLQ